MTRVEENKKVCEQWDNTNFLGNDSERVKIKMMSAQIDFLEDISKSLAQLADVALVEMVPPPAKLLSNYYNYNMASEYWDGGDINGK